MGKTNPLNDDDLAEFVKLQASFANSDNSWSIAADTLDENFDLSVKNPNTPEAAPLREPEEILAEIGKLDSDSAEILATIRGLL